jgi:hypothetical protein
MQTTHLASLAWMAQRRQHWWLHTHLCLRLSTPLATQSKWLPSFLLSFLPNPSPPVSPESVAGQLARSGGGCGGKWCVVKLRRAAFQLNISDLNLR